MLPKFIVGLSGDGTPNLRFDRIDEGESTLAEKDYDELLVKNHEVVADTLRQAQVIRADSTLKFLGTQVLAIDVLMAEVDAVTEEFRRLVLFEDKLLRNPESRRKVLGQIIEYAGNLEQAGVDSLKVDPDAQEWLAEVSEDVSISMKEGDFLLVLCGDQPHERMVSLARRFGQMVANDPLCLYDICTLWLAIYSHADQRLLVPNVVSTVAGAQRTLKILIRDERGVVIEEETAEDSPRGSSSRSEDDFFKANPDAWPPEARASWAALKDALQATDVAGIKFANTKGGRPSVMFADTAVGKVKVLTLVASGPMMTDTLHGLLRRQLRNSEAGKAFRKALSAFNGAVTTDAGRIRVPVASLQKEKATFAAALKRFASALDRC